MDGFQYRDAQLFCEDCSVDRIADEAGTPLYVYSKAALCSRYRDLSTAFGDVPTTVCFSVKSCSSLGVLNALGQAGSSFDVVSGGELFRVVQAGGDPARVVFAGVGKSEREIRYALEMGILMFNVESHAELKNIAGIAQSMGKIAPVALRLNPDVDPKTHRHTTTGKKENKFGLDLGRAERVVREISKMESVALLGLHAHIGSPVNSTSPYEQSLGRITGFLASNAEHCASVEYINVGGGFGLVYSEESVPAFSDYASVIVPQVKAAGKKLIIEPGRCIAGNAGILLSTVEYVKSNGEKTFVIIDTGMNDLLRPALYDAYHRIWPTHTDCPPPQMTSTAETLSRSATSVLMSADIVGPICESGDTFAKDRPLPRVYRGDRLAIFSSGAYGYSMSSCYNSRPRAAEVLVDGDAWNIIRRRETWEDLVALENT